MGRKASFDRNEALRGALKCFWLDGYDKTSLEDLLRAMEIQTSSFYNSFGSKEDLFVEAVQYYRREMGARRIALLKETEGGKQALLKYFDKLVTPIESKGDYPPGCFMMKTAAGVVDPSSQVAKEIETAVRNLENAFATALERGIALGEFPKTMNTQTIARLLTAQAYGLSVLVRTKKTKKELLETTHSLIESLST